MWLSWIDFAGATSSSTCSSCLIGTFSPLTCQFSMTLFGSILGVGWENHCIIARSITASKWSAQFRFLSLIVSTYRSEQHYQTWHSPNKYLWTLFFKVWSLWSFLVLCRKSFVLYCRRCPGLFKAVTYCVACSYLHIHSVQIQRSSSEFFLGHLQDWFTLAGSKCHMWGTLCFQIKAM